MSQDKRPQRASETDSVDIHDRVAEAYYGLMGPKFMRDTQNRIHWICREIQGKNVLDVGCSQGIVPILLAREGLKVVGIDSSPKAIDEANHYLASEPKQVRKNVSFVNSDFLSWDFHGLKIDTVVMSEVLEHLTRPDCFIEAAARILAKRGRLIVTVPFGINDFIDHKHTFYLLKPLRLISRHFDLVGIEVLGNWLGVVADRRAGADRGVENFRPTIALMEKLESAFYQTERGLRDELSLVRTKQEEANRKYRGATEQITALKQRVTQEETARRAAAIQPKQIQNGLQAKRVAPQQQLAQMTIERQTKAVAAEETAKTLLQLEVELEGVRNKLGEANQKYRGASEQVTALKQQLAQVTAEGQAKAEEAEKTRLRLEAELEAGRNKLGETNEKYRGASEQITTLKQWVAQEETARQAAEQALAQATTLREETQNYLQKERVALQQQLVQATAEGQAKAVAAEEATKNLLRVEAELETRRSQLEAANQKYRGASEQVVVLKQRVTEEETARQAAEQALTQATTQLEQTQSHLQKERVALQQQLVQATAEGQAKAVAAEEATKNLLRVEAELETRRSQLEAANQKYRGASEQVVVLKQRVTEEETARQAAEQALTQATTQLEQTQSHLQKERVALQQQLVQATAEGQAKAVAAEEATKNLLRVEAELETRRSQLEAANQKYRGASEQVVVLKQRVTEEETARQAAEQALTQATTQLEQTQSHLQKERVALQQQLVQATAEGQAKAVAAEEATKNLLRVEAELETRRSQLEAANQKYRGASEQVVVLKQRVTEEETARQAAEQQLVQATAEGQAKAVAAEEATKNLLRVEAELETRRSQLEAANQKYRGASEQVVVLKQRVTEEETARQAAEQALTQATTQLEQTQSHLQKERVALQQQLVQATAEGQAKAVAAEEATKNLLRVEAELETRRSQLEAANQKYRGASEQVVVLKQRVTEEETARQAAEQALTQATTQLEQTQSHLQKERVALQQQLVQATAEGQAKAVAAEEATKNLLRVEAELETRRSQLEAANQKYRGASEQVVVLKQRVTEEETARQAAEQALTQATTQWTQTQSGLQAERAALQQQVVQATAEGQAKQVAVQEVEGKLFRLEAKLEAANQKYRGASEQVVVLKQRVTEEETARQAAEQALTQATTQLEQTQSHLQKERVALQQQLVQATAEGQAKQVAVQEVEGKLSRLEAKLEEANQKYRGATEQLTVLKQRVTQEESARRATEQELRHTATQLEQANSKYRQLTRQVPDLKNKLEQQKIVARHQLEKTRSAISFRLGYLLIHNVKSVNGFLSLPSALWALRKETIRRHKKKAFIPNPPQLPPLSRPPLIVSRPAISTDPLSQELTSNGREISPDVVMVRCEAIPHGQLTIACIMDEFTFGAFQPEARLQQLTPSHWGAELEAATPDLLFIESAWRGKDDLWGNKVGHTSAELQGIVEWCRAKKVPTVFWCKEDPIHFETFLNTAMLFDYVFTTDIDCIHRYKAALGHDRVYLLPFACQPATNNPIETYQRKDAFCFAGAYYVRYPERTRDLGDFALELPAFRPLEIYDRNYGKNDPNYQFPAEYQQYIVGTLPFDQIDKAYKGYRYAINLNSIKQSQSMFARRVFELLASNTITISNFSRGLRLLFGDLVITTDSGAEIVRRLKKMVDHDAQRRKFRLAALRKVMSEHTYGQRLAYIVSKVNGRAIKQSLPHIAVLAYAGSHRELDSIQANYHRQRYADTSLYVVVGAGITPPMHEDVRVRVLTRDQGKDLLVGELDNKADLVAGMVAEDYYGPNYLADLALATRYTPADLIGKAARYTWAGGRFQLTHTDQAYHPVPRLPARAAAIRCQVIAQENVLAWVQSLGTCQLQADQGLAIDEFNYCEQGAAADSELIKETVDDLAGLNTGISIDDLLEIAENITPESARHDECPRLTGPQLAGDFGKKPSAAITLAVDGQSWRVGSTLSDGKHEYLYATATRSVEELGFTEQLKVYFDVTPGLNIQLVIQFLDAQKQKISHVIIHANRNQQSIIPPGTDQVRLGLRVYAGGHAEIKGLVLGLKNLEPAELIGQAEQLLLTNHYPSYDDLYRNGFVHTRVAAYAERGTKVDVFRLRPDEAVSYHEFEDVNVITGSKEVLHRMLSSERYKSVLVHFLSSAMWDVLQHHIERIKVVVWVHGAEIQPSHRRDFNHQTEAERAVAKIQSEDRMTFWRDLLQAIPPNLKLVFVSRYFSEEVMEDLGFRIPEEHYTIVHNPINTDLFSYQEKSVEQRKKVLSIRPYASAKYANDLSVRAIQRLSQEPWFNELEFRLIGDGPLFEETLAPLREFRNVFIEQRFLNQAEIAALHKEYGIFLCPTRMDAQGVSRDEAMASGLVPVTNAVTAIPEFVDDSCGILAPAEDADAMARGISLLYEQPLKFLAMSKAAASRVRAQSDAERIIGTELALISDDSEPIRYRLTA